MDITTTATGCAASLNTRFGVLVGYGPSRTEAIRDLVAIVKKVAPLVSETAPAARFSY